MADRRQAKGLGNEFSTVVVSATTVRNHPLAIPPQVKSLNYLNNILAKAENLEVVEKNLTRCDLYICDEFFLTGTAAEVIGIVEIDGRTIDAGKPGPITKLLREKFFEYAHGDGK